MTSVKSTFCFPGVGHPRKSKELNDRFGLFFMRKMATAFDWSYREIFRHLTPNRPLVEQSDGNLNSIASICKIAEC